MKPDLLCVGLTTFDIVGRPITELPENEGVQLIQEIACAPAGTAAGTACVAARLGVNVALAGAIGTDLTGRFVRFALEDGGIDTTYLQTLAGLSTSATILPIDREGRRPAWHAPGAGFQMQLTEAIVDAATDVRFLHYAAIGNPNFDRGPGQGLLEAAGKSGAVIVCDLIAPQPSAKDELERILPLVDWFFPSAEEARFLTGADDLQEAADIFVAMGAKQCVIKDGKRGAVRAAGALRGRLPAFQTDVVDTTTCGDAFCAGFIAARLKGWSDAQALRFATATAALVAQGTATYGKLESFEATELAMQTLPVREEVQP